MSAACELLEAYLDGRLSPEARSTFEAHAEECQACALAIESWRRSGKKLEAWAEPFQGPPSAQQLRDFRARGERPATTRWLPIFAGVAALAVAVIALVFARPNTATEWDVTGGLVRGAELAEAKTYRIGPDEIDVAPSAKVEVAQKDMKRTRLVLERGSLTIRVEPGRKGREFIIDSPPFRATVVGTVFEARRETGTFRVATTKGVVRVERLSSAGEVLDLKMVPAGSAIELSEISPPAPPVEEDDAGAAPALPPIVGARVVKPSRAAPFALPEWRKRAAGGECEAVYEETRLGKDVATMRVNADCARKLGMNAAAVDGYRKVISHSSGVEAAEAMLLAASLMQDELNDSRGVLELTKSIRRAPAEVAAALHVRRARAFQALGRKAEARAEVELTLRDFSATPAAADAVRLKREL